MITPIQCLDGKKHRWSNIGCRQDMHDRLFALDWCGQCGCVSEERCDSQSPPRFFIPSHFTDEEE